jgi:hypothetical protein
MPCFKVSFFKNLQNSDGQKFKCLQQSFDLLAESPEEAVKTAQLQFQRHCNLPHWKLHADSVEVSRQEDTG